MSRSREERRIMREMEKDGFRLQRNTVMKLWCSLCGKEITYQTPQIQLVTIEEEGKRYTGVMCDECSDIPPCQDERKISYHMVSAMNVVTMPLRMDELPDE